MLMQIGPRVDFAAPVGFGDYANGHPVVGTTSKLIVALSPAFDQGTTFASLGDAVIGADVPKRIGAEIKPMHGSAEPEGHEHKAHVSVDAAIDEHFDVETPGIPAVLVKPKTIADAYRLRQEYRGEATLAVFPAEVLTRLYATLGDARGLLLAIAIGTQILVPCCSLPSRMSVPVSGRSGRFGRLARRAGLSSPSSGENSFCSSSPASPPAW